MNLSRISTQQIFIDFNSQECCTYFCFFFFFNEIHVLSPRRVLDSQKCNHDSGSFNCCCTGCATTLEIARFYDDWILFWFSLRLSLKAIYFTPFPTQVIVIWNMLDFRYEIMVQPVLCIPLHCKLNRWGSRWHPRLGTKFTARETSKAGIHEYLNSVRA